MAEQDKDTVDPDIEMPFDDPKTDMAVDDIVAREGDELLAHMDAAASEAIPSVKRRSLWRRTSVHVVLFCVLVFAILTAVLLPTSRYWILNSLSVRASSSVSVIDDVTHQPLKNITVELAGATRRTGADGKVTLELIRLGPTTLKITKPGFAPYERRVTVGWGSNPLGSVALKAVGLQYVFEAKDWVTGRGIAGVEVSGGDAAAISDKAGKAVLTLAGTQPQDLTVTVGRSGYRSETVAVKAANEQAIPVTLVTSRKAVYVNKQSGKYDVYSSDVDGQNKQVILAGTGNENANISLAVSPDGSRAAVVSTRDNERDADGRLLNTLSIVTVSTGDTVIVGHASQMRLIHWTDTRVTFEQISSSPSTPANAKHAIISYDYAANSRMQLAAASRLSGVLTAQGRIYYAMSPTENDPAVQPGLYRINPDGNDKQPVLDKEVWTTYRTDYNTLAVQLADGWRSVNLTTDAVVPSTGPGNFVSRVYVDNPTESGQSLWIDIRSGQSVVLHHDRKAAKDTEVVVHAGAVNPIQWLTNDIAIFRVVTTGETADYAVSVAGGSPARKITDVANTYGFTVGQ